MEKLIPTMPHLLLKVSINSRQHKLNVSVALPPVVNIAPEKEKTVSKGEHVN